MLQEIEKEYKYLINKEQYENCIYRCYKTFEFAEHKLQTNYYYDNNDNLFNRTNTTIRIRKDGNKMNLQVKKHVSDYNGLNVSDEYSSEINTISFKIRIPILKDLVHLKGVLITDRTVFAFGKSGIICLDRNIYLGMYDYEVEIEFDNSDILEARSIIEFLGLKQANSKSKSTRFFDRLNTLDRR